MITRTPDSSSILRYSGAWTGGWRRLCHRAWRSQKRFGGGSEGWQSLIGRIKVGGGMEYSELEGQRVALALWGRTSKPELGLVKIKRESTKLG